MSFDKKKFDQAKFIDRTEAVPVPNLKAFYKEGEAPVWVVRGLSGEEWARANEAATKKENLLSYVEAVAAGGKEQAAAIKEILGISGETPAELCKRLDMFVAGSVDPKIDRPFAVKMAKNYPMEFYTLTNKIMSLTGMGREPGKPKGSGKTQESAQP